jgi:hypothetical protein
MDSNASTSSFPTNINQLVAETFEHYNNVQYDNGSNRSYANSLIAILKKHRLWPNIKVKKYKNNDDLVLLHNNYKMGDVYSYKELYEQCRSVVLDFSLSNNNVVVTYANSVPERISYHKCLSEIYQEGDIVIEAFDGTIITVYNYKGEWHFGTSSCPDANSSKFSHPSKSHGNMFDEILYNFYSRTEGGIARIISEEELAQLSTGTLSSEDISRRLRDAFVSNLDPSMAYEFLIVHHENIHIVDYKEMLGPDYKEMVHINTKNRATLIEDVELLPIDSLVKLGVKSPGRFKTVDEGYFYINSQRFCYGLIVKKIVNGVAKLYKVSTDAINRREETDPCHPNLWMNILSVYMKNKQDYTIKDYIANYNPNMVFPIDNNGKSIDATYLVHTIISSMKDMLYSYYVSTTIYYPKFARYKMNKEMDKQFAPIIQYHLAQLRNLQVTTFKDKMIKAQNVYFYLCQCNDVKNIKTLIQYFASNPINEMHPRASMCFAIMNSLIS